MNEWVTQVGVGGVFLLMVFKMLLDYLKGRNNKNCDNGCVTKDEFKIHKENVQYKDNCEEIVKRIDAAFCNVDKRFDSVDDQFDDVKKLIRNGGK